MTLKLLLMNNYVLYIFLCPNFSFAYIKYINGSKRLARTGGPMKTWYVAKVVQYWPSWIWSKWPMYRWPSIGRTEITLKPAWSIQTDVNVETSLNPKKIRQRIWDNIHLPPCNPHATTWTLSTQGPGRSNTNTPWSLDVGRGPMN